jgi:hypothetical protein
MDQRITIIRRDWMRLLGEGEKAKTAARVYRGLLCLSVLLTWSYCWLC